MLKPICIKSIKKISYQGKMYNLTIKDDETYIAEGIIVHNCRCTKIPITMAYKKANNIKWNKKPPQKTLDMIGKDFRDNPKNLKQYSNKISKKLTDVEKKNIELNNNIKQSLIPKTEKQYNKEAMEYWNSNKEMKKALKLYTTTGYKPMNSLLRGHKVDYLNNEEIKYFTNKSNILKRALKKAPEYKGVVYRAMGLKKTEAEMFFKQIKAKKGFIDKGFVSTTIDKKSANDFGVYLKRDYDVIVKFELKAKNGSYLGDGSPLPEQGEVLFNTGSKIKIDSINKVKINEYLIKGEIE